MTIHPSQNLNLQIIQVTAPPLKHLDQSQNGNIEVLECKSDKNFGFRIEKINHFPDFELMIMATHGDTQLKNYPERLRPLLIPRK
ncbi:MAG: hypothetical protein AMR96_06060 [Candidatus Adiutrix intracellularis]|nr:MAG: hypothetical protein AMR96_06060 [Candidatus Adiutrix intracellularis]